MTAESVEGVADPVGAMPPIWDVVVAGAGPAGAMVALELRRLGCSVLLLERETFPRWKVCGACLSPGAQGVLKEAGLGNLALELGGVPLEHLEVRGWGRRARVPLKGSLAVSRAALDMALSEAARAEGATVVQGVRVRLGPVGPDYRQLQTPNLPGSPEVRARVLIAADGVRSGLLGQAGVQNSKDVRAQNARVGLGAVFEAAGSKYSPGTIHMAVGEAGYVGLVRVEDGALDVAAAIDPVYLRASDSPGGAVNEILAGASFPPLSGEPSQGWRGTRPLTHTPRRLGADRLFSVGDAAGYVEPFTGEGMCWALAGSRALAPIAARAAQGWHAGFLGEWRDTYSRTVGQSQRLCSSIAWTLRHPALSRMAVGILGRYPGMAAPLVGRAASAPPSLPRRGS